MNETVDRRFVSSFEEEYQGMKEDVTRRDFLKAAGLAVAGVVGASALSRAALAQEQKENKDKDKDKSKEKDEDKDKSKDKSKEEPNYDELFGSGSSGNEETRACPQCGSTMYRQGRTWTCENCGYSYVE